MSGFDLLNKPNDFDDLIQIIKSPNDYFDFPFCGLSFAYSLKGSILFIYKECVAFRKKNKILTLFFYSCSGTELNEILAELICMGYKIKSLNFVNKDFGGIKTKFYMWEYYVEKGFGVDYICSQKKSKRKAKFKYRMRKCESEYEIDENLLESDVNVVFYNWINQAQKRIFMVIKGHYKKYIDNFFVNQRNAFMFGFRNKQNKLVSICGYEIFKNFAQITIMKNEEGVFNEFPVYFWVKSIEHIFCSTPQIEKVFCGSTVDELKNYLCMDKRKSYKVLA